MLWFAELKYSRFALVPRAREKNNFLVPRHYFLLFGTNSADRLVVRDHVTTLKSAGPRISIKLNIPISLRFYLLGWQAV